MLCDNRSIKHPEDSEQKTGDRTAASEGNDDFDLEKFILEETRYVALILNLKFVPWSLWTPFQ